jgi:disease resistance protein RPS2
MSLIRIKEHLLYKTDLDSLQVIKVRNCEKLKRMPICLPLLENGEPSPPPPLRRMLI